MKIPNEVIPTCFKYSKQAFEGKITKLEARLKIHEELQINYGSAKDYFLYYSFLINGEKPTWSLNKFTLEYFLQNILIDCKMDSEQQKKTLLHFKTLIEKLEGSKIGSRKSMRLIYEKYSF